jgi:hypothetical protein
MKDMKMKTCTICSNPGDVNHYTYVNSYNSCCIVYIGETGRQLNRLQTVELMGKMSLIRQGKTLRLDYKMCVWC